MSTTKLFRAGLIATVGIASLAITAEAQSRYGTVYDYESGRNCGQACTPAVQAPVTSSRYGAPVVAAPTYNQPVYNPAPVYVDCVQAGTCAPQPSVVYTQPAPVYSQPSYTQPSYSQQTYTQPSFTQSVQQAPASCPAGTTPQSDGTCLQGGGSSSFSSSTTYSSDSYSSPSYSAPSSFSSEPVNCPSGTTAQSDGTCMQTGSSFGSTSSFSSGSSDFSSATTYSDSTYSAPSSSLGPVNCPAGTTAQPDGTCMQGGGSSSFVGSSVELYSGDAASTQGSATTYGYGNDGSYGSSDYLPIRK